MRDYYPQPIKTDDVELPQEIDNLAEAIAKNVHDVWALTRIEQGWSYGKYRDDNQKRHPCIVPYEDLSEDEKQFDRNTSQETLKLIIKLGYKIIKENSYGE